MVALNPCLPYSQMQNVHRANPGYMLRNCPYSCNLCGEESRKVKTCADTDRKQCTIWGEVECESNPASVMRLCPEMCGLCETVCADRDMGCRAWAKKGSCVIRQQVKFMTENCPQSCGVCSQIAVFPERGKVEL